MFDYINQGLRDAVEKKASTAHNALQMADNRIAKLEQALRDVEAVMGPKAPPCCDGCEYEWNRALVIVRGVLGHNA